jgi:drug/metabolite transporter (DMT)-like permease
VAWTLAGRHVGALGVSFVRLIITCVFLSVHGLLARGLVFPTDASATHWQILGLSGFVGFFVSDLFLFKAFLLIGPRLSLLIYSLTPPITALLAWSCLSAPLPARSWLAMAVTLAGVVWVVLEQPERGRKVEQRRPLRGIVLAAAATFWQAVAILLTKAGVGDYDAAGATYIRVLGGLAGYVVLVTLLGRWSVLGVTLRHPRALAIMTGGAIVGPYLGVMLYVVALKHCSPGVVATITATMPVLILPFSIWLDRERVSPRALLGALVSVTGIALLVT